MGNAGATGPPGPAGPVGPVQILFNSGGHNISANQFVGVSIQNSQEVPTQQLVAVSGHFTAMYCATGAAPGGATSVTFTLRKNGADTSLTCTITGLGTSGGTTGASVAFNVGDLLDVAVPNNLGGANKTATFAVVIGP